MIKNNEINKTILNLIEKSNPCETTEIFDINKIMKVRREVLSNDEYRYLCMYLIVERCLTEKFNFENWYVFETPVFRMLEQFATFKNHSVEMVEQRFTVINLENDDENLFLELHIKDYEYGMYIVPTISSEDTGYCGFMNTIQNAVRKFKPIDEE